MGQTPYSGGVSPLESTYVRHRTITLTHTYVYALVKPYAYRFSLVNQNIPVGISGVPHYHLKKILIT